MYWKIEPYHSSSADCCVLPAETEDDHRNALEYAKNRLIDSWDGIEAGESKAITIELCNGDIPAQILETLDD